MLLSLHMPAQVPGPQLPSSCHPPLQFFSAEVSHTLRGMTFRNCLETAVLFQFLRPSRPAADQLGPNSITLEDLVFEVWRAHTAGPGAWCTAQGMPSLCRVLQDFCQSTHALPVTARRFF